MVWVNFGLGQEVLHKSIPTIELQIYLEYIKYPI